MFPMIKPIAIPPPERIQMNLSILVKRAAIFTVAVFVGRSARRDFGIDRVNFRERKKRDQDKNKGCCGTEKIHHVQL